jgi:hypothetical protein
MVVLIVLLWKMKLLEMVKASKKKIYTKNLLASMFETQ